jgi:hypothetical protein
MATAALARPQDADPVTTLTLHERIGFELGWDYAHYRLQPPAPYAAEPSPLRDGLLAGQAAFGQRTLQATRHVRKWLQLRLSAWLRGRSVALDQVTPCYLKQIDATHCPITRKPLSTATLEGSDASVDRVRNDAGYAAGNLAVMSAQANGAKGARGFRDAMAVADHLAREHLDTADGLGVAEWRRIAILASFVEPLPHAEAAALPMLVLPPNRLRLFNPAQALQALVSRLLLTPGWAKRARELEQLLPGAAARRAFQMFFHALLPRVLEARLRGGPIDGLRAQWVIEDAWRNPLVLKRWTLLASALGEAGCQRAVQRAAVRGLAAARIEAIDDAEATDGWNLASRGYVPHAVVAPRPAAPAQATLSF